MAHLGLALLLWILPTDACKCDTTAGYHTNVNNIDVLRPVYGNATTTNRAGRVPVLITGSLSKNVMNTTETSHAVPQQLSGTAPYSTRVTEDIVAPESVNEPPPQVPLSCLRSDVTCTLKTTMTKFIATETVLGTVPVGSPRNMETGTLEGGHTYVTEDVDTTASSPTSTGYDGSGAYSLIENDCTAGLTCGAGSVTSEVSITCTSASTSTTSKEKPVFSYDPINTSTSLTETDDFASPKPTTSASLNALSVLESALSALTTTDTSSSSTAQDVSSMSTVQGSQSMHSPLPTEASDTSPRTHGDQHDKPTSEATDSIRTIHIPPSVTTITSSATSFASSNEEQAPHFTFQPTSDEDLPATESKFSTTDYTSQSRASLTYAPLQSTSTTLSPSQTTFAYSSLTVTAGAVSTLSQAVSVEGTTLSAGGAPVTLGQGEVLSYATDGLVVAKSSGFMQSMSTVTIPEQTGRETSGELPKVVQLPAPSDSSSETTSAADATSTKSSEEDSDSSNGSQSLERTNGVAIGLIVIVSLAMLVL